MHAKFPRLGRSVFALLLIAVLVGCGRRGPLADRTDGLPTRSEILAAITVRAERYRIEPAFVYALVAAESNFDPRARNGAASGLLQLKPIAWQTVTKEPFEPGVWEWRANLEAGIDYLAYSRAYLHRKNVFSYPLLLAAFHYGLDYVEERKFDLSRIPVPENEIYRRLWAGELSPVPLPTGSEDNKKPAAKTAGEGK